jgi:regulator of CtrA degradation
MSASTTHLGTPSGVAVLDGLLNETLGVAAQARVYLTGCPRADLSTVGNPLAPLVEACELSRLAARLGFCVSWLLARRAVHAGGLSHEEARQPRWRLEGAETCLVGGADARGELPTDLRDLLDRSLAIYRRVARLDRRLDA